MPFAAGAALPLISSTPAATVDIIRRCRSSSELRQLHAHILKSDVLCAHPLVLRRLLSSLSGAGDRLHAASILYRIPQPDALLFVSVIGAFSEAGDVDHCFNLYSQMLTSLEADLRGAEFSLPSLLKVCAKSSVLEEGRQLHAQVSKNPRILRDPFVANSVLRMYLDLGQVEAAALLFDTMPVRDVISYNSMISGCFRNGNVDLALRTFDEMPQKDVIAYNSMIDGLMKCGRSNEATEFFDRMAVKDVISWTSMISGFVLNGRSEEAVGLFRRMLRAGVQPDAAAIVNVLSAIADLGFAEEGKWVHDYVRRNSSISIKSCSSVVGSALIDMYSKCGLIDEAYLVFNSIAQRGRVGDWNSMISGLAMHGLGQDAMEIFEQMEDMGIEPDEVTFLGLLKACNHSGLVKEGQFIYRLMREKYQMELSVQHYGCVIDLLGRAGLIEEAQMVVTEMPMEPDVLAWKSVLSACVKHGYTTLAEEAAIQAIELAPDDSSNYVLLSNMYAKCGRWADVEKVRSMMKERGVKKAPGCSTIMVDGDVHEFLVGWEGDVLGH